MKNCINRSNEPWGLSFAFRVSSKLGNLLAHLPLGVLCCPPWGGRGEGQSPSHPAGCCGLWKPKFSHSRDYVLGCLVKIICIIFCLCGWQRALQIKEKRAELIYMNRRVTLGSWVLGWGGRSAFPLGQCLPWALLVSFFVFCVFSVLFCL